ncbi:tetratricopeptide repeat protein [Thiohalocapsa halophila]|uniref:tetratricopeptide repeat protein n=1 Tax=Thiohalocapsa halophila TaxID=69359 RepID=UPI0019055C43|nr:tetratricopeptide repeat protein [Thiohalocapsa halophila]
MASTAAGTRPVPPTDPHRRTKLIAAGVAALSILCLLALVIIVAREQMTSPAMAVADARGGADAGDQRQALEALLARDPHDDTAVAELAALATAERRWREAAEQWGRLAKLDPLHPDARYEQARALLASGDADAATVVLGADGRESSGREQVLLARAALLRGDREAARRHADAAAAAAPGLPALALLQADLAFLAADDARAEALYTDLLDAPDTAAAAQLGLAQIALRRDEQAAALSRLAAIPADAGYQALRARAALYRQLGRDAAAATDLRALIERYGPVPDLVVPLAELTAAAEDAGAVRALRESLLGSGAAALAARHYLQAMEVYLRQDLDQARDYLGWSADFFAGRDLYRWMQLDVGARLGDPALVGAGVRALQDGIVSPLRQARAAAVLTAGARDFADAGDADTAAALADAALTLVPELASARLVAARAALLGDEPDRAEALASALLDDADHRAAALEVLGRAALRAGDTALAAERFAELAATVPDAGIGRYWQGVTAARAGDLGAAESHLRAAYTNRADPRVEAALMDVLMAREDWQAAEALASTLLDAEDAATRARARAYLGGLLRARGEQAAAAQAYAEAAATDPARAAYALAAADLFMAGERWTDAEQLLAAAAARHPDNRYLAFKQALLAQRAGRPAAAERRYRALLADSPGWALPMVNLSELLTEAPEALELAERAAALTPEWSDAQWNLAQRRAEAGDTEGALAAARAVLALAPEHAGAQAMVQRLGDAT